MTRVKWLVLALVCLFCMVLPSCLDGKTRSALTYDAASDTFRLLRVYYNIRGGTPEELAYLATLWDNRNEVLPAEVFSIFSEDAFVRAGGKSYYKVSLGEAATRPAKPEEFSTDLSQVKNEPGRFFLSPDQTLCYYHQMEIPGRVIDALIGEINPMVCEELAKGVATETKRRQDGGTIFSWDDLRSSMLPSPTTSPAANAGQANDNKHDPITCISDESLHLLGDAATQKTLGLARHGKDISFTIPLSEADQKQLAATLELAKSGKGDDDETLTIDQRFERHAQTTLWRLITLSAGADHRCTGTADLVQMLAAAQKAEEKEGQTWEKPDHDHVAAYAATIAAMRAHGATVDGSIQLEGVTGAFEKGTLPVDAAKASGDIDGLFKK